MQRRFALVQLAHQPALAERPGCAVAVADRAEVLLQHHIGVAGRMVVPGDLLAHGAAELLDAEPRIVEPGAGEPCVFQRTGLEVQPRQARVGQVRPIEMSPVHHGAVEFGTAQLGAP